MKILAFARYRTGGFWIRESSIGRFYAIRRSHRQITMWLPADPYDFETLWPSDPEIPTPAIWVASTAHDPTFEETAFVVEIIALTTTVDIPGLELLSKYSSQYCDTFQRLAHELEPDFDEAIHGLQEWVRAESVQDWLGEGELRPIRFGRFGFFDKHTGEHAFGVGKPISRTFRSPSISLSSEVVDKAFEGLRDRRRPPVEKSLMADARALLGEGHLYDYSRATLWLAMACEIAAKQFLQAAITASGVPNDIDGVSDLSTLLDSVMRNVIGGSLKDADLRLYRSLSALGRRRHKIVHTRASASRSEGRQWLVDAELLLDWLAQMGPPERGRPWTP